MTNAATTNREEIIEYVIGLAPYLRIRLLKLRHLYDRLVDDLLREDLEELLVAVADVVVDAVDLVLAFLVGISTTGGGDTSGFASPHTKHSLFSSSLLDEQFGHVQLT